MDRVDLQNAVANKIPSDEAIAVREYVCRLFQDVELRLATRSRDFEITFFGEAREDAGGIVVGRIRNKFQPKPFERAEKKGEIGRAGIECKINAFAVYFSVEPDSLVGVTEQR